MSGRPELKALTSVRGIAAWLVVMFHVRLALPWLPPAALAVFAKGYLAVDFFFLLSGFVIWMTWIDRIRTERWSVVPHFLHKRVARIWPLHLLMLGAAVGIAGAFALTGRVAPFDDDWTALPANILLIQNWGLTDGLTWNDPSWSISAELAAYLLFPLLAMTIDWRRLPSAALIAVIVALAILLDVIMTAGGSTSLGINIAAFGVLRCLVEFTSGGVVCALWLRWRDRPTLPGILAIIVCAVLLALWLSAALPEMFAIPCAFAALLLALALSCGAPRNPLEWALLHYLGEISYATYLSHFVLFAVFKLVFVDQASGIPPVLLGLFLLLVLGVSIALYELYERPAQRWVNALAPRRPANRKATA
jgi:peptidoglycan/LPS O-acetylase OafA/YrhL